jgi:hypothetical protein
VALILNKIWRSRIAAIATPWKGVTFTGLVGSSPTSSANKIAE